MSIYINSFEKNLMDKLQRDMSKKDAEEAIMDIRFGLYRYYYHIISTVHYCDEKGNVENKYPTTKELIGAYYSDDYSKFRKKG